MLATTRLLGCSSGGEAPASASTGGGGGTSTGSANTGGTNTGGDNTGGTNTGGDNSGGGGSGQIDLGADGTLQIWTVGDSITEGVNNGYRNQLWSGLTAAEYTVDFVGTLVHPYPDSAICPDADHDGHAGYGIGGIAAEIDVWYGKIAAPDVVLMMAGTNDIAWWVAPGAQMTDVAAEMLALVDHVLGLDPDLAVLVGTIAPMSSKVVPDINVDRAQLTIEYNDALTTQLMAHAQYGTRLWRVDINAALTVDDLYDGIHPTRAAHDKLGNAWLGVLTPLLSPAK